MVGVFVVIDVVAVVGGVRWCATRVIVVSRRGVGVDVACGLSVCVLRVVAGCCWCW